MGDDINAILRRLDELAPEIIKIYEEAMDEALDVILVEARDKAPRDTGRLKASLRKSRRRRRGNTVRGTVGTFEPSAMFNEFGTQFMKPRPFLYPALRSSEGRVREIFERRLKEGLDGGRIGW